MLEIPLNPDELKKDVEDAVKRNQKENDYIRLVVSRGEGDQSKSVPLQKSFYDYYCRGCPALSRKVLFGKNPGYHIQSPTDKPGLLRRPGKVTQLFEKCPREDRGGVGGMRRSGNADTGRLYRRMHSG